MHYLEEDLKRGYIQDGRDGIGPIFINLPSTAIIMPQTTKKQAENALKGAQVTLDNGKTITFTSMLDYSQKGHNPALAMMEGSNGERYCVYQGGKIVDENGMECGFIAGF